MYVYCLTSDEKFQTTSCAGRMLKIRYPKRRASDFQYNRSDAHRMSSIRHSTDGQSNVKNPTFDRTRFGCRIFDIRLCGRSNRKNPIQQ